MSKKSNKSSGMALGRILIKSRNRNTKKKVGDSMIHTSEIQDGSDFNRINFTSITEQTGIDDFLSIAELAGTDFTAEKLNVTFARPAVEGILSQEDKEKVFQAQVENRAILRIPRRPAWDRSTSPEELAQFERDSFLQWRRSLSLLQEKEGIILTPYEKNLEFWRQLWRVIERSDVVVQIVDARDPLLFYCEDLQNYIEEVSDQKEFLLLVNKADFLTEYQRELWAKYFSEKGINAIFFSALMEDSALDKIEEEEENQEIDITDLESDESENRKNLDETKELANAVKQCEEDIKDLSHRLDNLLTDKPENSNFSTNSVCETDTVEGFDHNETEETCEVNTSQVLTHVELINFFRHFHKKRRLHQNRVTIGFVGYPNVGKSSTINSLMTEKKVSVSATPGKTKHFQTLFLTDDIVLCDCPGLVFPAFVNVKSEMIISGILPIDQMRDHIPPMNLTLSHIPRHVLEATYGVLIPKPLDGEDPDRVPTSEEFLSAYGFMRGYMTPRGIPDHPRSARYILKDYVLGKLLFCHCPPGALQSEFHVFEVNNIKKINIEPTPQMKRTLYRPGDNLDKKFFEKAPSTPHFKGQQQVMTGNNAAAKNISNAEKPWRQALNSKRCTKGKLRIKFAHLDD